MNSGDYVRAGQLESECAAFDKEKLYLYPVRSANISKKRISNTHNWLDHANPTLRRL